MDNFVNVAAVAVLLLTEEDERYTFAESLRSLRSSLLDPTVTISAPNAAVPSRLILGAFPGITMTALVPSARAA